MELDDPGSEGAFESYWTGDAYQEHVTELRKTAQMTRRRMKPAPEGVQDVIVKDHLYGYQGCFDAACTLLDPHTRKPVSARRRRKLLGSTRDDTQEWCIGENGMDQHSGMNKYYTTFEECCNAYHQGRRSVTSLAVPDQCRDWNIDYTYYVNQQDFAALEPTG